MPFNLNWIDWTIVGVLLYYAYLGWESGFADLGLSFITFLVSFWLSIKFHAPVGDFLGQKFGIPQLWTTVLGYLIVGFIAEAVLSELASYGISKLPKKMLTSKYNKFLGVLLSIANGLILVSFVLLVILALPLRGTIKDDIKNSKLGNFLMTAAEKYGAPIQTSIEQAKEEAIKFLTVEPGSNERVALDATPKESDLTVDDPDERKMLDLVNTERVKAGLAKLVVDVQMVKVARAHSRDMFLRRYFSHVTPEGLTAGDRLEQGGIKFTVAGENIAYAPDVDTAHTGLMNSPGHRRNILDGTFHRIGIGIISTDNWGIMITQDFAN